jgi:hypothetical protein
MAISPTVSKNLSSHSQTSHASSCSRVCLGRYILDNEHEKAPDHDMSCAPSLESLSHDVPLDVRLGSTYKTATIAHWSMQHLQYHCLMHTHADSHIDGTELLPCRGTNRMSGNTIIATLRVTCTAAPTAAASFARRRGRISPHPLAILVIGIATVS